MAEHQRDEPFAGTLSGTVHWEASDGCLPHQPVRTLLDLEGALTPLGRTKAAGRHCADDRGGGFGGRMVFTGDGGEALRGTYTFETVSTTPAMLTIRVTGKFVDGGTGRFARASGPFEALVHVKTVVVPPVLDTVWPVEFTLEGRVSY